MQYGRHHLRIPLKFAPEDSLQTPQFILIICRALMPQLSLHVYLQWSYCPALMTRMILLLPRFLIRAVQNHSLLGELLKSPHILFYLFRIEYTPFTSFVGSGLLCKYSPFYCFLLLSIFGWLQYFVMFLLYYVDWFISFCLFLSNLMILEIVKYLSFHW